MTRLRIPIEEVQPGDVDPQSGKRITNVLNRTYARFIRATLEGGWPVLQGYYGEKVEVLREPKEGKS